MASKKKKKRISQIHALELRIGNMEIALAAMTGLLKEAIGPVGTARALDGVGMHLYECNTSLGGYTSPQMAKRVDPDE